MSYTIKKDGRNYGEYLSRKEAEDSLVFQLSKGYISGKLMDFTIEKLVKADIPFTVEVEGMTRQKRVSDRCVVTEATNLVDDVRLMPLDDENPSSGNCLVVVGKKLKTVTTVWEHDGRNWQGLPTRVPFEYAPMEEDAE